MWGTPFSFLLAKWLYNIYYHRNDQLYKIAARRTPRLLPFSEVF